MQPLTSSPPSAAPTAERTARETQLLVRSGELLGANRVFKRKLTTRIEVHEAIVAGALRCASLTLFLTSFKNLEENDVLRVLGISGRTLRRQKETPKKPLPAGLASRTWLLAETLAKATEVLGSKERAEEWMNRPATGLDGRRPIEMLQTVQGTELVTDYLTRLEYNVYS